MATATATPDPKAPGAPNGAQPAALPELKKDETPTERYRRESAERTRYSQMEAQLSRQAAENDELRNRLAAIEGDSKLKQRYSRIEILGSAYAIDVDDEQEFASKPETTDEVFEAHVGAIEKYGRRLNVGAAMLPVQGARKVGVNDQRRIELEQKIIARYAQAGVKKSYDEIRAEAAKESGQ